MTALNYPLSNAQLELLKLFSRDLPEEDLIEIKQMIVNYLAKKLAQKADEVWEEKGWTNEEIITGYFANLLLANTPSVSLPIFFRSMKK